MAKSFAIDDDVRQILSECEFDGSAVRIVQQLDRPTYERVNKVLTAAGGKWNRKQKAHVFLFTDPKKALGLAVETGVATNFKQETQYFRTPDEIADRMVDEAAISTCHTILEPSAGCGSLIKAVRRHCATGPITAIEKHEELFDMMAPHADDAIMADFMEWNTDYSLKFDRIVMNPPFSNQQDIAHILHAAQMLTNGGKLVALCGNGPRQQEKLMPLIDEFGWCEELPDGSFIESGTNVNVLLLVLDN